MDRRDFLKAAAIAASSPLIVQGLAQASPPGGSGLVKGLAGRDDLDPRLGSWNPRARWANLQPEPFGPIVRPNAIDQARTDALSNGKRFRVRLDAGRFAPPWVLAMGSVVVVDPEGGGPSGSMGEFSVPTWWTSQYLAAYDDFLRKLGAAYDGDVSAITLSAPMTIYAEPFLRQAAHPSTRTNLKAAGYSRSNDRTAFWSAIDTHARYFKSTRTVLTLNPAQTYDPGTDTWNQRDNAHMEEISERFIAKLGKRAILQNCSLNVERVTTPESYRLMYAYMQAKRRQGIPIAFQTSVLSIIGDLKTTLETAIGWGAHLVELPKGYQLTDAEVAGFDSRLQRN